MTLKLTQELWLEKIKSTLRSLKRNLKKRNDWNKKHFNLEEKFFFTLKSKHKGRYNVELVYNERPQRVKLTQHHSSTTLSHGTLFAALCVDVKTSFLRRWTQPRLSWMRTYLREALSMRKSRNDIQTMNWIDHMLSLTTKQLVNSI